MLWSLLFIFVLGTVSSNGDKTCLMPHGTMPANALCNTGNLDLKGKNSSQSSTHTDGTIQYTSDRAFDGDYSTCSNTKEIDNSWWTIDLRDFYNISCISIFNKDANHVNLNSTQIYIGNSTANSGTSNTMVQKITNFAVCKSNVYNFTPTVGRYITVVTTENKPAILCEVNITATKLESRYELVKENKTWEEALYHCRDLYRDLASILTEEDQAFAELEAEKADTEYVWLGLHYTCTLQFWFWVDDNAITFERWHSSKIEDCDTSVAMETKPEHLWATKSDYTMFNFICER